MFLSTANAKATPKTKGKKNHVGNSGIEGDGNGNCVGFDDSVGVGALVEVGFEKGVDEVADGDGIEV